MQVSNTCQKPFIAIDSYSLWRPSPTRIPRSRAFAIVSDLTFDCPVNFIVSKKWSIDKLNSAGSIIGTVSIANNPSSTSSQLVIQANTLEYGIYAITISATLHTSSDSLKSWLKAYVEIVPTGFAVLSLANMVQEVALVTSQSISLEPKIYSYDLDKKVQSNELSFSFYCRRVIAGVYESYPSYPNGSLVDLRTQKNDGYPFTQGCFKSSSECKFTSLTFHHELRTFNKFHR